MPPPSKVLINKNGSSNSQVNTKHNIHQSIDSYSRVKEKCGKIFFSLFLKEAIVVCDLIISG